MKRYCRNKQCNTLLTRDNCTISQRSDRENETWHSYCKSCNSIKEGYRYQCKRDGIPFDLDQESFSPNPTPNSRKKRLTKKEVEKQSLRNKRSNSQINKIPFVKPRFTIHTEFNMPKIRLKRLLRREPGFYGIIHKRNKSTKWLRKKLGLRK